MRANRFLLGSLAVVALAVLSMAPVALAILTSFTVSPNSIPANGSTTISGTADAGTNCVSNIKVTEPDGVTVHTFAFTAAVSGPCSGIGKDISGGGSFSVTYGSSEPLVQVAGSWDSESTAASGTYHVVVNGLNGFGTFDVSRTLRVPEFALPVAVTTALAFALVLVLRRKQRLNILR